MAGKTCFMRTIGVNLLAAKTLHTCFAEVFEINTGISLLSSIHQGDNLMENKELLYAGSDDYQRFRR